MTDYPLATLPGLPVEAAYEIFSRLEPEEAANLCATSREFRIFCEERKLRIRSIINAYRKQRNHELSFLTILEEGRNRADVEYLEALLRLHPEWLNTITVNGEMKYTLFEAKDPLIIGALLELGSDPLIWFTNESVVMNTRNYDTKYVKDKSIPLIYYLAAPPSRYTSIILLTLCLRLGKIPSDLLSVLIADGGFNAEIMYAYISRNDPNEAKLLNDLLKNATYRSDYLDCRVLLELGADPLSAAGVDLDDGHTITIVESTIDGGNVQIVLLMFHYTPLDMKLPTRFISDKKYQKLTTEANNAASQMGPLAEYSYLSLLYAYSQGSAPYWNDINFWSQKWDLDLPNIPKPLTNNGAELRLAYRSEITKGSFDLGFKDRSGIGIIPAKPPTTFQIRVGSNQEIQGLIAMLEILNVFQGVGYEITNTKVLGDIAKWLIIDASIGGYISKNTMTTLPWRNYVATFNRRRLQFDSLGFLEGTIKACRLLGYDPKRYIKNFTIVTFD